MDVHGLFVAVQMRSGKGTRFNTGAYALFTGTADFHGRSSLDKYYYPVEDISVGFARFLRKKHRKLKIYHDKMVKKIQDR